MRNALAELDWWIILQLEVFSHWAQRTTGIVSVQWSRLFILITFVLITTHKTGGVRVWGIFACSIMFLFSFAPHPTGTSGGTINPWRRPDWHRSAISIIVTVVSVLDVVLLSNSGFQFLTSLAWYFDSLNDLPPGQSKLSKWWDKAKASLIPASAPMETPI